MQELTLSEKKKVLISEQDGVVGIGIYCDDSSFFLPIKKEEAQKLAEYILEISQ